MRELDPRHHGARRAGARHLERGRCGTSCGPRRPHLYKVDGTYYLVAAEGGTEFHHAVSRRAGGLGDRAVRGQQGQPGAHASPPRARGRTSSASGTRTSSRRRTAAGGPSCWACGRTAGTTTTSAVRRSSCPSSGRTDGRCSRPVSGRSRAEVEVPFAGEVRPGVAQGVASGTVATRRPAVDVAARARRASSRRRGATGWDLRMRPSTLSEPVTRRSSGVRQQHTDVDVRATSEPRSRRARTSASRCGSRRSDHVRLFVDGRRHGAAQVVAVQRRGGVESTLGELALADGRRARDAGRARPGAGLHPARRRRAVVSR